MLTLHRHARSRLIGGTPAGARRFVLRDFTCATDGALQTNGGEKENAMLDRHTTDVIEGTCSDFGHAISRLREEFMSVAIEQQALAIAQKAPHVLMRPTLKVEGNQFCALYGENLIDGIAGFGDTPAAAMADFDRNWQNYSMATKTA